MNSEDESSVQELREIDPILELAILYLYSMLQLTLTSPTVMHEEESLAKSPVMLIVLSKHIH